MRLRILDKEFSSLLSSMHVHRGNLSFLRQGVEEDGTLPAVETVEDTVLNAAGVTA